MRKVLQIVLLCTLHFKVIFVRELSGAFVLIHEMKWTNEKTWISSPSSHPASDEVRTIG